MKKLLTMLTVSVLTLFALPSCEMFNDRVPKAPESSSSALPHGRMEKFEQNSIFGPMERRR